VQILQMLWYARVNHEITCDVVSAAEYQPHSYEFPYAIVYINCKFDKNCGVTHTHTHTHLIVRDFSKTVVASTGFLQGFPQGFSPGVFPSPQWMVDGGLGYQGWGEIIITVMVVFVIARNVCNVRYARKLVMRLRTVYGLEIIRMSRYARVNHEIIYFVAVDVVLEYQPS